MVQSDKYHKSCAVGVTSELRLTTDRDLAELSCLRNTMSFIPLQYQKSRGTSHYTTLHWFFSSLSFFFFFFLFYFFLSYFLFLYSHFFLSLSSFYLPLSTNLSLSPNNRSFVSPVTLSRASLKFINDSLHTNPKFVR